MYASWSSCTNLLYVTVQGCQSYFGCTGTKTDYGAQLETAWRDAGPQVLCTTPHNATSYLTTGLYQFGWSPVSPHDIIDMHMYYDSRNKLRCITTMMKRSHARQHVHKHSDSRDIFTSIIRAYTHDENIKCTVTVMAYLHARHPSPKG